MKIGLRVLMALNEKRAPDPADLDALRHFTPLLGDLAPDELACEVIQRAIEWRAEVRAARLGYSK